MPLVHKSGKKNRKYKRNEDYCKAYKLASRELINKAIKLARHMKKHPTDVQSMKKNGHVNYTRRKPLAYFEEVFAEKSKKPLTFN